MATTRKITVEVPEDLLERAVEHFQQLGYVPFLLVDRDVEHEQFVARFAGVVAPSVLEREPVTTVAGVGTYDLSLAPPAGSQPIQ